MTPLKRMLAAAIHTIIDDLSSLRAEEARETCEHVIETCNGVLGNEPAGDVEPRTAPLTEVVSELNGAVEDVISDRIDDARSIVRRVLHTEISAKQASPSTSSSKPVKKQGGGGKKTTSKSNGGGGKRGGRRGRSR